MTFERNVFLNCPFDKEYRALLPPILFTVSYLGFEPRIASESCDAGLPRLEKILNLIRESKYAIHDISRLQARSAGDVFRLNMPFELGLDFGCRIYRGGKWREKRFLVLAAEPYRYRAALSDLAGSDIQVHENDPEIAVREVRDWLSAYVSVSVLGAKGIWGAFGDFRRETRLQLRRDGHSGRDLSRIGVPELKRRIGRWIRSNRPRGRRFSERRGRGAGVIKSNAGPGIVAANT